MGGKSSGEIKETYDQKVAADVAAKQWALYQDMYVPVENQYISNVQGQNAEAKYSAVSGAANASVASAVSDAQRQNIAALVASGADPSSGRFLSKTADLGAKGAALTGDTKSRAQYSQQSSYLQGMGNVVALGQGQATSATAGFNDIAQNSAEYASSKAQSDLNSSAGNQYLAGTVAGFGAQQALSRGG